MEKGLFSLIFGAKQNWLALKSIVSYATQRALSIKDKRKGETKFAQVLYLRHLKSIEVILLYSIYIRFKKKKEKSEYMLLTVIKW